MPTEPEPEPAQPEPAQPEPAWLDEPGCDFLEVPGHGWWEDDGLPRTSRGLMRHTAAEARCVRARAEQLTALPVLADALLAGLQEVVGEERWLDPAHRFVAIVHHAADRVGEAVPMADRAIERMYELLDRFAAEDAAEPEAYERVLTARLHVPMAEEIVGSATLDGVPALRHLARLAMAAALDPLTPAPGLERLARAVLRLPLGDLPGPTVVAESPQLWSVSADELRVELAGLLANLVVDRRTYLILEHQPDGRYVQVITYDAGLQAETVADEFLPAGAKLSAADRDRLDAMGWSLPEPGTGVSPNWFADWDDPVDVRAAAELLVWTLIEVHGLTSPTDLHLAVGESVDPFAG